MYWVAAIAYTLQIYFDFSGYSDMAIGLGRVFGFHFLENFDHPYISLSITEFWRRWHISLSSWFRDYIYIPLGGNRVGKLRWIFNILVVWALTGFWHGAQWNFLLWGLYYAVLLLLEKLLLARILERIPKFFRWLYTMFFVVVGWVIFDLTDFSQMLSALKTMFTMPATPWLNMVSGDTSILYALFFIPLGLVCMLPLGEKIKRNSSSPWAVALSHVLYLVLAGICITITVSSSYNPFIYFRF
jgi:alginate O-acetyltransferase complex protein AlgI